VTVIAITYILFVFKNNIYVYIKFGDYDAASRVFRPNRKELSTPGYLHGLRMSRRSVEVPQK
jgi:hypothetical protein